MPNQVKSDELNNLITKICLENFNSEAQKNHKKVNKEMGRFTCQCFVDKIAAGLSLQDAQEFCRKKAISQFNQTSKNSI
ncbi:MULTISPECIES: hypothetical protein [Prochlorococcus]|uniref:hypothetical protein n=1 Tax=Prochlorococcus TaxID=1218 RepID=UPI000533B5AB|nr:MULTISPECIES: hypothetical protein [Prochlorococcus]KGG12262.1 hypothetical protein EV05_1472 [Prochlorococcus sp. MIT 0601]